MLLIKKSPAYACLLLIVLFLTSGLSYAVPPAQFNITVTQKGSGAVTPSGKVAVLSGQNQLFTFQPSEGYEVFSVKVDGKSVSPTPVGSYTVSNVTKAHALSVVFAKKIVEIHLLNQSLQMGSMQPAGSLIKVPYDGSQTFTAKPKKGYLAILRVDGKDEPKGSVNKSVSVKLDKIIAPHTIDVRYEAEPNEAVTAIVHINAKDPNGLPLHYRWKVSEGQIENLDQDTVQWTLPVGPGVHFANVLVSNNQGGYAARRIAVISDNLGTSPPAIQETGKDFEPTSTVGKKYAINSVFMVSDATDQAQSMLLTRFVYLPDVSVPEPTLDALASNSQGRIIEPVADINYTGPYTSHNGSLALPYSDTATHPHTHTKITDYIVGSVQLADGSLCGIDDKFHGVDVAATAIALDKDGKELTGAVKANAYGDYALPWQTGAAQVLVQCEDASVTVPIYANRIALKAVLPFTGQPIITPKAASMTAKINNRNVGIFLPPELKQPSDLHPSGDKFLGFKGMDTLQQACEYYKSIGATQGCDLQGNPVGAITFDDWKRKMQMEPYATPAGKEVDATYVNRIDLNLTRRHHAISYDDLPGVISVSTGYSYSCALKADMSLVCWGDNYNDSLLSPVGSFKQISMDDSYACAVKIDGAVACWGYNGSGQASPPAGNFNQVTTGLSHACGIKSDGTIACWGDNVLGQSSPPVGVFSQISAGDNHTCAIKSDDTVNCWGDNSFGQASPPSGSFSQVSANLLYTCGVKTDGAVVCWGDNSSRKAVPAAGYFSQVSAGNYHACGVQSDGAVICWGSNDFGQASPPAGIFTQVSASAKYTCGVKSDATVTCWGDNTSGQASPPRRVAAYVCNHLGPKTSTRRDLEWAISNALNDRNQVACVAMDYQSHSSEEAAYVRFYVFTANGQLSLSINLDGRQEKYVPGTCVACHGGDKYEGHFPGNGSGSPDVGAHFLPYDIGNFLFSARPGLTKADQQAAIHQLNNIVLQTNATSIERTLINSWYKSGTDVLDENYLPGDWKAAADAAASANPPSKVDIEGLYKNVNARYCRTCHVALNRDGMGSGGSSFDNPERYRSWSEIVTDIVENAVPLTLCGNSPYLHDNHTMPNSLVTFNLLWNDKKAVNLLQQIQGKDCKPNTTDPELSIRP